MACLNVRGSVGLCTWNWTNETLNWAWNETLNWVWNETLNAQLVFPEVNPHLVGTYRFAIWARIGSVTSWACGWKLGWELVVVGACEWAFGRAWGEWALVLELLVKLDWCSFRYSFRCSFRFSDAAVGLILPLWAGNASVGCRQYFCLWLSS